VILLTGEETSRRKHTTRLLPCYATRVKELRDVFGIQASKLIQRLSKVHPLYAELRHGAWMAWMSFPSHWHWQSIIQYAVPHCSGRHYMTRRGAVQLKSLVSAISVEFMLQGIVYRLQHLALISGLRVRSIVANPSTSNTGSTLSDIREGGWRKRTFDLCLQKTCRYCMYSTRMPADP
jgi:hypothetical protein